jgi:hypothetical protein
MTEVACVALAVVVTGCDWEGQSSDAGWNTSGRWLDYSGVYRGPNNSAVVQEFSSDQGATTGGQLIYISDELAGVGNGTDTVYAGLLDNVPVYAGSVQVVAGGFALVDDGAGNLSGSGATGNIDYDTGAWSIDLGAVPLGAAQPIMISYAYTSTSGGGSGGSQIDVRTFAVEQSGNLVQFVDSNGDVFTGYLGKSSESVNREVSADDPTAEIGVVTQFEVEGTSRGVPTRIIGSFQAIVVEYYAQSSSAVVGGTGTAASSVSWTLLTSSASLAMDGTWIQDNGVTGQINGVGPADKQLVVIDIDGDVTNIN